MGAVLLVVVCSICIMGSPFIDHIAANWPIGQDLTESLVDVCRLLAAEKQELQTPVRPPDTIHQEQDLCDV